MPYRVFLDPAAQRQRKSLPSGVRTRVDDALRKLADDPRPHGCTRLAGSEDWRVRVGDYRMIYAIDDQAREVVVGWIGPRKDAYRRN